MNRIGIGRTAEVFEMDNDKILKLFYENIPYDVIKKEYDVNTMLSSKFKKMPKVFELVAQDNRHGIVFQKVSGSHMGEFMSQNPNQIATVIKEFSLLHNDINDIRIDAKEMRIDTVNDIIKKIQQCDAFDELEKNLITRYLIATDEKQVCHGDFHPENVLVDSNSGLWVIDWMTIVLCNKMFDIARTFYILRYGQSPEKKPFVVKKLEKLVCLYLSNQYYKNRIKTKAEQRMFTCFLYVVLLLRCNDGIAEESTTLRKLIKSNKKKALKEMSKFVHFFKRVV